MPTRSESDREPTKLAVDALHCTYTSDKGAASAPLGRHLQVGIEPTLVAADAARPRLLVGPVKITAPGPKPSRLLGLPAEIREQIWAFTVTEWAPTLMTPALEPDYSPSNAAVQRGTRPTLMLQRLALRMDRLNRPAPPAITRVCRLTRSETLRLYYAENTFECWRPLCWLRDWEFQSTFVDWLTALGGEKMLWLTDVVLLYKHASELEFGIEGPLEELGFELGPGVVRERLELSEYELSYEAMGLPRRFGKNTGRGRRFAGGG